MLDADDLSAIGGFIVWDDSEAFCRRVAAHLLAFAEAREAGTAADWLRDFFGVPYPADDPGLSAAEVAQDMLRLVGKQLCSAIRRCPQCGRVHVKVSDVEGWESFTPERAHGLLG
jgi:hypothetical protein